uniref:NADP-dependent oxidoreductase domain-containing protein n=1 Tax=Meleagris gallopavo TaxID=9103 RepID=G1NLA0_MELGA
MQSSCVTCSVFTRVSLLVCKSPQGTARVAVKFAITVGYHHFDCTYMYQNELGEQLPALCPPQLWCTFHEKPLEKEACWNTLAAFQLDYLDLCLIFS